MEQLKLKNQELKTVSKSLFETLWVIGTSVVAKDVPDLIIEIKQK